ncbi:MAG: nucleotidyltransferase domain-containing protein [Calditrichaeota bacterium]|nr:nucleotidyltransferase domain-containing protein [Calditrichota bacterium]
MIDADRRTRAGIEPILKEIVEVLVREYQPELIILYGSYAYGNPTRHSDIDLFIVKETEKNRFERNVEAARLNLYLNTKYQYLIKFLLYMN